MVAPNFRSRAWPSGASTALSKIEHCMKYILCMYYAFVLNKLFLVLTSPSVDGGSATWPIFDLWGPIFDLWGKKSKFRRITFLHMAILHISMWYQHNPMKTVGRVRESMKKTPKTTSFSLAVTLTLTGWPWDLCPDIHVSKVNIPCKFREIRIMGK